MLDPFLRVPGFDITPGETITQTSRWSPPKTQFHHLMGTRTSSVQKHAVCFCFPHGSICIISSQSPALLRNPTTRENIFGQAQARTDVMSLTGITLRARVREAWACPRGSASTAVQQSFRPSVLLLFLALYPTLSTTKNTLIIPPNISVTYVMN